MKTKTFLLLSLLSTAALPATAETTTVDGVTWTYRVENGYALLGGGSTAETAIPRSTSAESLLVPSELGGCPVRTVGRFAFNRCDRVPTFILPAGLSVVDTNGFASCYGVHSISFPDSLRQIGNHSFYNCINLERIDIPHGVETIEDGA